MASVSKARGFLRKAALLSVAATVVAAGMVAGTSGVAHAACPPEDNYDVTSIHDTLNLYQIGSTWVADNQAPETNSFTHSRYVSGTVSASVSASVTVSASWLVAGVEAEVGVEVGTSVTAGETVSVTVTVPAWSTRYVRYGAFRVYTSGTLYRLLSNCTTPTITIYSAKHPRYPSYEGYRISTS